MGSTIEPQVASDAPHPGSALLAAPPAGPRGPTSRQVYGAGCAAPANTVIVLDTPYDGHISHAKDGSGSEVSQRRLTSLSQPFGCMNGMPKVVTNGLCTPRHLH